MRSFETVLLCSLCALSAAFPSAEGAADPFVKFADLPEAERLPRNAALAVAEDGTFRVNGRPRYLTATVFYGGAEECRIPTSGYGADLRWLYEDIPGYENMQRLGVDALGFESGREWMRSIPSAKPPAWKMSGCLPATDRFASAFAGQLPAYVDFTPAGWGHGGIEPKDCPGLPREAWTAGENHWVPYSVLHPEGRRIWLTMWGESAKRYAALPVRPWCYELMNEPSVLDTGAYAKARFRETGRPDDPVEYLKFVEEAFASLIAEGARCIRAIQPDARVTLQPVNLRAKGVDVYRVFSQLDVVCSPTGGGTIPVGHVLRALADGKPIVDGETYIGTTRESLRNSLVKQFQRGFNASYTFKWSRRPRDWARGGDAAKEAPLAKRLSSYYYLNPYVVPTDALIGFRLARRDIQAVGDFFIPRDRGTPRRIAVLYSNPTERLAIAKGVTSNLLFDKVVEELEYAHLNPDVIFEEQLKDDPARLDRYALLVAAGTAATEPGMPERIRAWTRKGGRLVAVGTALFPGATEVAAEGVPSAEIGRRLAEIASACGIEPGCETRGAEKVEVTDAVRGDERAWIVTSRAVAPQVTRFRPRVRGEMTALVRTAVRPDGRLVTEFRELEADADGCFALYLKPNDCNLLVTGPRAAVLARGTGAEDCAWLPRRSAAEGAAACDRALAEWKAERMAKKGGYRLDANRTRQLDLRRAANVRKLTEALWGLHEIEGVPFGFIRTDQNDFKDAVRLDAANPSLVLPLEGKAQHAYFAYTGGFAGKARYADGTSAAFVAPASADEKMRVWRWTFARGDKDLVRLELKSESAVVFAVTLEAPADTMVVLDPDGRAKTGAWPRGRLVADYRDGVLTMRHGETPASWSCAHLELAKPVPVPAGTGDAYLVMEVSHGRNRYGAYAAAPSVQVAVDCRKEGKRHGKNVTPKTDDLLRDFGGVDADPETWETVYVGLGPVADGATVGKVNFQYKTITTSDPSPLVFRNFRLQRIPR